MIKLAIYRIFFVSRISADLDNPYLIPNPVFPISVKVFTFLLSLFNNLFLTIVNGNKFTIRKVDTQIRIHLLLVNKKNLYKSCSKSVPHKSLIL